MLEGAHKRRILLVAFMVLAGALYAPFLGHEFIWDDYVQIAENPSVRDGVPLSRYFLDRETTSARPDYNDRIYRPLRNVAFRALWRASDLTPAHRTLFFHAVNLLLYLLGGWLVFRLCARLCRDEGAAALAAGLWLLLPVHAEDVLYASALGDLLSLDLQLAGLLCAIRALEEQGRPIRDGAVAIAAFVLAVFVKEMAITSAVLVPIFIASEYRGRLVEPGFRRRALTLCGLHAACGLAYLAVRTMILKRVGQEDVHLSDTLRGIAEAPWLLLKYLQLALMPLGHAPDYGTHATTSLVLAACALVGLAVFAWCNLRPTRGVRFGAWLYVVALGPVLHFVPLWTLMADRFLLVPSVGLAILAAGLMTRVEPRRVPLAYALCAVLGLVWSGGTALEARRFQSDESFFAYGVEEVPDSALSQHNLGLLLLQRGDSKRALEHLLLAEALGRKSPRLYLHLAGALDAQGRYDDAARAVARAIQLTPSYGSAYAHRAALERRRGDLTAAEQSLELARANQGEPRTITRETAALRVAQGRLEEAYDLYRALASIGGRDASLLWQHAAECAQHAGRAAEALDAAKHCLGIEPTRAPCQALAAQGGGLPPAKP